MKRAALSFCVVLLGACGGKSRDVALDENVDEGVDAGEGGAPGSGGSGGRGSGGEGVCGVRTRLNDCPYCVLQACCDEALACSRDRTCMRPAPADGPTGEFDCFLNCITGMFSGEPRDEATCTANCAESTELAGTTTTLVNCMKTSCDELCFLADS